MNYTEEQVKKPKSFLEVDKKEMNTFEWFVYHQDVYYEQNKEQIDREKKERLKKESGWWWKTNRQLDRLMYDYPILVLVAGCLPIIVAILLVKLLGMV